MTRSLFLVAIAMMAVTALTACETTKRKRMPVTPQPMSCAGNIPASVTLYSPDEAKLIFDGKSYILEREETASGVKYGHGKVAFWNKGINAVITNGDKAVNCTYIPKPGL